MFNKQGSRCLRSSLKSMLKENCTSIKYFQMRKTPIKVTNRKITKLLDFNLKRIIKTQHQIELCQFKSTLKVLFSVVLSQRVVVAKLVCNSLSHKSTVHQTLQVNHKSLSRRSLAALRFNKSILCWLTKTLQLAIATITQ